MRDLNECKAEVFRRMEKGIEKRKKRRIRFVAVCTPLCLCMIIFAVIKLPTAMPASEQVVADCALSEVTECAIVQECFSETQTTDDDVLVEQAYMSESSDIAFDVQYIRTDGYNEGVLYPFHTVIGNADELTAYFEKYKNMYDLLRKEKIYSDTTIGFLDACDRYDASFFEDKALVLVVLEEGSGSIRHKVTDVKGTDTVLQVHIESIIPETGTDDMAEWHIMLEIDKSEMPENSDNILIYLNGRLTSGKD